MKKLILLYFALAAASASAQIEIGGGWAVPLYVSTAPSGSCVSNNQVEFVTVTVPYTQYICAAGTWQQVGSSGGSMTWPTFTGLTAYGGSQAWVTPTYSNVVGLWTGCTSGYLEYNGTCSTPSGSFTAGGDLSGTSTSQEVVGILSHALPSLTAGYLNWTGSAWALSTPSGSGTVVSSPQYSMFYQPNSGSSATATGDPDITTDGSGDLQAKTLAVGSAGTASQLTASATTIASLPAASTLPPVTTGSVTAYTYMYVKDGTSVSDCTTGGGSTLHWCFSNGTTWTAATAAAGLLDPGANGIVRRTSLYTTSASELSGDCVTDGSNATNCAKSPTTLTDGSSVTWTIGGVQSNATLTGAHTTSTRALNLSGVAAGDYMTLSYFQDSTGGAYLTGGSGCGWYVKNSSGYGYTQTATFFTVSPGASQADLIVIYYDGTNCWAVIG